jgi:hypothetical protein
MTTDKQNATHEVAGANSRRKKAAAIAIIVTDHPAKLKHYAEILRTFPGNDALSQRTRLVAAMRYAPVTTYEAQKHLDVYDPPSRAWELRHYDGYDIETFRVPVLTDAGVVHRRIGLYVLKAG